MKESFSVPLVKMIQDLQLEVLYAPPQLNKILVKTSDVNRPSLQIVGFFDYFDADRVQILGKVESTYLSYMTPEERLVSADNLFSKKIPALVVSRGLPVFDEYMKCAQKYNVPILSTPLSTSRFMSVLISYLNTQLAPRQTVHGVLIEVYGEGALILGESGVGKSETAMELVKRGHRLIADDAVELKRVSDNRLIGMAPENIKHFIELRGIGIVDVPRIFGMGAVKEIERVDLVINMEVWDDSKQYDRLGLETQYTEILGVKIPSLVIPVRPGRNLAIILEVACMNNKQRRMGYNAAQALNDRLTKFMQQQMQNFDEEK